MTPLERGVARFAGWNIGPKSQHSEDTAVAGHKNHGSPHGHTEPGQGTLLLELEPQGFGRIRVVEVPGPPPVSLGESLRSPCFFTPPISDSQSGAGVFDCRILYDMCTLAWKKTGESGYLAFPAFGVDICIM